MDPKLRKFLERSGLPVTATEAEAIAFMEREDPPSDKKDDVDLDTIRAEAKGKELERIREIDALLEKYECQDIARKLIVGEQGKEPPTLADAQRAILDRLQE